VRSFAPVQPATNFARGVSILEFRRQRRRNFHRERIIVKAEIRTAVFAPFWKGLTLFWKRRYAEQRGFTIVRVFEDSGRSGLRIDNRDGLQSLMLEVQSGTADFQAILVYDVSRWGGFPNCRS
jgi:hypothetical protein